MRMTMGTPVVPFERYRYLAMCEMTWSRAGYENASNCISQTGFHPAWVRPSETPAMAASARGVSNTRCSPNSAWRPSVMRKTPPSLPMSSPRISTRSSPANESRSARFSAWAIVTSAIAVLLGEPENLVALPDQDGWQLGEDPPEQILDVAGRGALDAGPHRGGQVLPPPPRPGETPLVRRSPPSPETSGTARWDRAAATPRRPPWCGTGWRRRRWSVARSGR